MSKKVIFLDAGHGGIDPNTGEYTTAPSKMFKFSESDVFYEGVKNRAYCSMLHRKLVGAGVTVVPVYHEYKDTPLSNRTFMANWYHSNIQEGIYVSEHSNATRNHNARGFSIWTSPGQTKSDEYAEKFVDMYDKFLTSRFSKNSTFEGIKIMKQLKDGDADYEAKFHVLTRTNMPSILFENLFFDHPKDASILRSLWYMDTYTDIQAEWIKKIIA